MVYLIVVICYNYKKRIFVMEIYDRNFVPLLPEIFQTKIQTEIIGMLKK